MRLRQLLTLGIGLLLALYVGFSLEVDTDISGFMPDGGDELSRLLSRQLLDGELSRTLILALGADRIETAVEVAGRLARELGDRPEVASLRSGLEAGTLQEAAALYFPRRYYLASENPEEELPELLSDPGLERAARGLHRRLSGPQGVALAGLADRDPLQLGHRILKRLANRNAELELVDGQFVTADRERALLFVTTASSGYDARSQRPLFEFLELRMAELQAEFGDSLLLEYSGVHRFSTTIEGEMRGEMLRIAGVSSAGVLLVFAFFFRSLRALFVAAIPHLLGMLVALAAAAWWFGPVTHLAVGFAVALSGVSIDYSVHLMNHVASAPTGETARETAKRLRASLILGALTTVASFVGLAMSSFPGFTQMGWVAAIGVGSALVVCLTLLPDWLEGIESPLGASWLERLEGLNRGASRHRRKIVVLGAVLVAVALSGFGRLQWSDDLSALSRLDPELLAEDQSVRRRFTRLDLNRFAVVTADSFENALRANDELAGELSTLVADGRLEGFESLHSVLWSAQLQERNLAEFRASAFLDRRLREAFQGAGFSDRAFSNFGSSLEELPPPLTLADLEGTPMAEIADRLRFELDGRTGLITYLGEAADEGALAEAVEAVDGAALFEQKRFIESVYATYRERVIGIVASGTLLVLGVLWLRYRSLRLAIAALTPSILAAACLIGWAGLAAVPVNLIHLLSFILVMGIGVDYGIFSVDTHLRDEAPGVTQWSLVISCLTTFFVFGTLALSSLPALRAMGGTTALGLLFSLLAAPMTLLWLPRREVP